MKTRRAEKLFRLDQVAEAANLSLRTIQTHVRNGDLKVVRVGPSKRPRVLESDMRRYLGCDNSNDG